MSNLKKHSPSPVHLRYLDGKVALKLSEVAKITGFSESRLLQFGNPTLFGAPPPTLRFCLRKPKDFQTFKVTADFAHKIVNYSVDENTNLCDLKTESQHPELFENFDYLVLDEYNCRQLWIQGEVDVQFFWKGIVFDNLDAPRPLPFEDPASKHHRILAISKAPRLTLENQFSTNFCLSNLTITTENLLVLVSDLSQLINLEGIKINESDVRITNTDPNTNAADIFAEPKWNSVIHAENMRINPATTEQLISQTKTNEPDHEFIFEIDEFQIRAAPFDLQLLFEVAQEVWGENFQNKERYPSRKNVAKILQNKYRENKIAPPPDKPADHLSSLIRPKSIPRIPNDTYEVNRNCRFVSEFLYSIFQVSKNIQSKTTNRPTRVSLENSLTSQFGMPKHLAQVGARAILNEFSSFSAKKNNAHENKKSVKPSTENSLDILTDAFIRHK